MKAIILCCDKYHPFAYHTILTYQKLWPNNRFVFYIPWATTLPDYIVKDPRINKTKVVFVKCANSSFKGTMNGLLGKCESDEWIYWCSSDQYLVNMNETIANQVEDMLETNKYFTDPNTFGVSSALLKKNGMKLIKRTGGARIPGVWGGKMVEKESWNSSRTITLWFHQYLRVKVLKHIFNAFDEPNVAKNLDKQLYSNADKIYCYPKQGKYFTIDTKIADFGENTSRGKILTNTVNSFKKYGIDLPTDFEIMDKELYWR